MYEVTMHGVKALDSVRFVGLRRYGPFQECGATFAKMGQLAGELGLFKHPGALMGHIVLCNPEKTEPKDICSAAAVIFPEDLPVPEGLEEFRVPKGLFSRATLKGPYNFLPNAWGDLLKHTRVTNQMKDCVAGEVFSYECYLNSCSEVSKEEVLTELVLPVEHSVPATISISKVYKGVTPEQVFKVWENPETRKQMGCDMEVREKEADFVEGSSGSSYMKNEHGEVMVQFEETFVSIVPNQRIVLGVKMWDAAKASLKMASTCAYDFFPCEEGTLLMANETYLNFDGQENTSGHKAGYEALLEKIDTLVSR